ncbi:MAG TPA: universal stress protein [Acidimicrobiales bacterium]|nr:universal stress protein [Acidimicrobiales bacterium]
MTEDPIGPTGEESLQRRVVPISRIVVGVDGSDNGARAVAWAAELATVTGAEVIAVHAVGLLERLPPDHPDPGYGDIAEAHRLVEGEWTLHLHAADIAFRWHVAYGQPVSLLLQVVDETSADLVVVGTRGRRQRAALMLGSTSHQLAERSPCPVVIVPPGT